MKTAPLVSAIRVATLEDVLIRLAQAELSSHRLRDLRSAVTSYAKLIEQAPSCIALDLEPIRRTLDSTVPAQAKISSKRWTNLRSDLAAAIHASGLRPMLKTANLSLNSSWASLLSQVSDQGTRTGLSRFARWASLSQISPEQVSDDVLERFVRELEEATLVRNLSSQHRTIALCWNRMGCRHFHGKLSILIVPSLRQLPKRIAWQALPAPFRTDVDVYLTWCAQPDPLDDQARPRRLAEKTIRLR